MMMEAELQTYLREHYPKENAACEWKEFKSLKHALNSHKGDDIVSYVSAIANMEGGHLLIGVADKTLEIIGIRDFHDYTAENIRQRIAGKCLHLDTEQFHLDVYVTKDSGKTVWVLRIPKHLPRRPVSAHDKNWQRLGDSLVEMRPERLDAILNEAIEVVDWSAQLITGASLDDLDPEALALARQKFKERHHDKPFFNQIDGWEPGVFLNRVKLAVNGQLTRAALLLLGKPESAYFLSPHPAQITWKLDAEERAYEHFGPPFLLTTTQVLHRIRNITHKLFPNNQLLGTEVMKYDTRVILEALHNCIAHQDYSRHERILVIEKIDRLVFENAGRFFDGAAEDYFLGKKTPSHYRNPLLSKAMVELGMIDTVGYGIHAMTVAQRNRYFPLPDYERSTPSKVVLEIFGHSINENYSLMLLERQDLPIDTVILLDRVQKHLPITDAAAGLLRKESLIEGRKPNYHVSAQVAASTGTQVAYTHSRGLEKAAQKQFVIDHLRRFGSTPRKKLDELLMQTLSVGLTPAQKLNKIKNLLTEMRAKDGSIVSSGVGPLAAWQLAKEESSKVGVS